MDCTTSRASSSSSPTSCLILRDADGCQRQLWRIRPRAARAAWPCHHAAHVRQDRRVLRRRDAGDDDGQHALFPGRRPEPDDLQGSRIVAAAELQEEGRIDRPRLLACAGAADRRTGRASRLGARRAGGGAPGRNEEEAEVTPLFFHYFKRYRTV